MHHSSSINRTEAQIEKLEPVTIVKTGKPGQPRKVVDLAYVQEAMTPQCNILKSKLACLLGIGCHTLNCYLRQYNVHHSFSNLTDAELDTLVCTYQRNKPVSGIQYLVGFLRARGFRVQKCYILELIHCVDGLGHVLRQQTAIHCQKYKSSHPNALWHCDGHHKLILWGIVICGFVDGYCRTVCVHLNGFSAMPLTAVQVVGMHASTNNYSDC